MSFNKKAIQELLAKATKGPYFVVRPGASNGYVYITNSPIQTHHGSGGQELATSYCAEEHPGDPPILAASWNLAQTALAALEAIEEIRKVIPGFVASNTGHSIHVEIERILREKGIEYET